MGGRRSACEPDRMNLSASAHPGRRREWKVCSSDHWQVPSPGERPQIPPRASGPPGATISATRLRPTCAYSGRSSSAVGQVPSLVGRTMGLDHEGWRCTQVDQSARSFWCCISPSPGRNTCSGCSNCTYIHQPSTTKRGSHSASGYNRSPPLQQAPGALLL